MAGSETFIVIRVCSGDKGALDWTEQFSEVTFTKLLELINQVEEPSSLITAFEYPDEDGDRITVRSDEEMDNMLSYYMDLINMSRSTSEAVPPLLVFPRVGKSSKRRNIDGLTVKTKDSMCDGIHSMRDSPISSMDLSGSSTKQDPQDLGEILSCGDIKDKDLHYVSILGSGNCGTVHKAIHRDTNAKMAVKVISLDISAETQKNIISELQVLYKCESNVIISFYGAYFLENKISICTEFMDGGSLDKYGQIPEAILGRMSVSVVDGLQYLWSFKIMHRDVKPSNILVNTNGQVKLCDFGVSVQLVNSIAKTYVGTNAYMAPERIKGEDYSIHSEVWSLGLSLFEMAIGKFPYDNLGHTAPGELLNKIVMEAPPAMTQGFFTAAFVDFVQRCMQKSPAARPKPNALKEHDFIRMYNDGNIIAVAQWVFGKLEEIRDKDMVKAASC